MGLRIGARYDLSAQLQKQKGRAMVTYEQNMAPSSSPKRSSVVDGSPAACSAAMTLKASEMRLTIAQAATRCVPMPVLPVADSSRNRRNLEALKSCSDMEAALKESSMVFAISSSCEVWTERLSCRLRTSCQA